MSHNLFVNGESYLDADSCQVIGMKGTCQSLVSHSLQYHDQVLFMEFSRQEYWSWQPFPSPGDLPNPGIKPTSHIFCTGRWVLYHYCHLESPLMAQTVKNLPEMRETQVHSLGWEDLLEKGMATNSSILAWRIPWTKEGERERNKVPICIHKLRKLLFIAVAKKY